ncbi:DUF4476 domain-containing protein [Sphingobacterium spiritivorum]|uniref:DUF4476 domain-containing protein n=3 Tax=Sphingobacterium spiritivorum TaxID=258 RepID=UPI003DA1D558
MIIRKLFFSLIAFLCLTSAFAQTPNSTNGVFSVFSEREPFILYLNNVRYNDQYSTAVRIERLEKRSYDVRLEFKNRRLASIVSYTFRPTDEDGYFMDKMYLVRYSRVGRPELRLFAMFPVEFRMPDQRSFDTYDFGYPNDPVFVDPGEGEYSQRVMTTEELKDAIRVVNRQGFDSDKAKVASMIAQKNSMTVKQIGQVLDLFSFDEGKLTFARAAYATCYDRRNYHTLLDKLVFSDSKEKLMSFINSSK